MNTPLTPTPVRPDREDWRTRAECVNHNPEWWFSDRPDVRAEAKRICRNVCTVAAQCLADALDQRIRDGIYGGEDMSESRFGRQRKPDRLRCLACERPMRPKRSDKADYPGTMSRWSVDLCVTCGKKALAT